MALLTFQFAIPTAFLEGVPVGMPTSISVKLPVAPESRIPNLPTLWTLLAKNCFHLEYVVSLVVVLVLHAKSLVGVGAFVDHGTDFPRALVQAFKMLCTLVGSILLLTIAI